MPEMVDAHVRLKPIHGGGVLVEGDPSGSARGWGTANGGWVRLAGSHPYPKNNTYVRGDITSSGDLRVEFIRKRDGGKSRRCGDPVPGVKHEEMERSVGSMLCFANHTAADSVLGEH